MFRPIKKSDGIKLTRPLHRTTTSNDGSPDDSSPRQTKVTSTIPRMHALSLSYTQNRQDGDAVGDIHRWWYGGHGSCNNWMRTFQCSRSAVGSRWRRHGRAAHALEECTRQVTRTRPTADAIRRGSPLPQPVATARSSREPLPCRQWSLSNERASKWCDSSSQSCTRLYSIGWRRRQVTNC